MPRLRLAVLAVLGSLLACPVAAAPAPFDIDAVLSDGSELHVVVGGVAVQPCPLDNKTSLGPLNASLALRWRARNASGPLHYSVSQLVSARRDVQTAGDASDAVRLVGLGTTGDIPAGSWGAFGAALNCTDKYVAAVHWRFLLYGSSGGGNGTLDREYDPTEVAFDWACARPGCNASCALHGRCETALGHCECEAPYQGINCEYTVNYSTAVCPGEEVRVAYAIPEASSCLEWYHIVGADWRSVAWAHLRTGNMLVAPQPCAVGVNGSFAVLLPPVPGKYNLELFTDDPNPSSLGTLPLLIRRWDECGNAFDCRALPAGACEARAPGAACDNATGYCACPGALFWADCSHGCAESTLLAGSAGTARADRGAASREQSAYMPAVSCAWLIAPADGGFDDIVVEFAWLDVGTGDTLYAIPGNTTDTGRAVATFFGNATPPPQTFALRSLTLLLVSDYSVSGRGFELSYRTRRLPLAAGAVGGISAAATLVFLALLAAGAVWAGRSVAAWSRRRAAYLSEPAATWDDAEAAATEPEGPRGPVRSLASGGVRVSKVALFNRGDGLTHAVNEDLHDTLVVTNASRATLLVEVLVPAPRCAEMAISAAPGHRTLRPGRSMSVAVTARLYYTTRVARRVLVRATGAGGAAYEGHVSVRLEGCVSEFIDPAEVAIDAKPLGVGAYGAVYTGVYRQRRVAVKMLRRQEMLTPQERADFVHEVELYKRLRHPYIVEFIGASPVPGKLSMYSELMEHGSLQGLVDEYELPPLMQAKFALDAAEALRFLHSQNVLYRDMKPSNVLVASLSLGERINCKLGDFGTSRNVEDVEKAFRYTHGTGTPVYMSPEMLSVEPYCCKSDVFSFGVTLWVLATGELPWDGVGLWDIPLRVKRGDRPPIPAACSDALRRLIAACWAPRPDDRPHAAAVVDALAAIVADERRAWAHSPAAREQAERGLPDWQPPLRRRDRAAGTASGTATATGTETGGPSTTDGRTPTATATATLSATPTASVSSVGKSNEERGTAAQQANAGTFSAQARAAQGSSGRLKPPARKAAGPGAESVPLRSTVYHQV
eukprot:m51a1_g7774 putative protein kinase domain containing protein (1062) ;mRNA; f:159885-163122